MNRVISAAAIIAASLVLVSASAAAGSYPQCEDAVGELLATLGVDPADIRGIAYVPVLAGGRGGTSLVAVQAWVDLKSCSGSVVVETNLRCRVKKAYTRGECRIPDLKAY